MNGQQPRSSLTPLGRLISLVLVVGLIGLGVYLVSDRFSRGGGDSGSSGGSGGGSGSGGDAGEAPAIVDFKAEVPRLAAAQPFTMKDNVVPIEISEYAGYAGIIAANGGLDPTENSVFFKNHGFKVKLTISEDESWSDLNQGKIAGSVTTVDVLAAYGRQFHAVVPVQIGFSRGADGLIVRNEIRKINDLKGKLVATSQFTEADFFLRYLAQEAGLQVNVVNSLDATLSADRINAVYTEEGEQAGLLFQHDIKSGGGKLAGAMTWEPTVSEVVEASGGVAKVLVTNKNLLVVADILVLHRGFAEANPKIVQGLVQGVLEGNRMVRDNRDAHLDTIARAFKWTRDDARDELSKVHLSNLPENLAFFSGAIDAAGSFGGIYQSAVLAYGPDLIKDPPDAERFASLAALKAVEGTGQFKDQKIAISPIRSGSTGTLEGNPLLSKDIRFLFEPNSASLDLEAQSNLTNLDTIKKMLVVSPGSTILLRGHVDNALVEEFRRKGGEAFVRTQALKAMELSRQRAGSIKQMMVSRLNVDPQRIEVVGRGWEEPVSGNSDENRRVEVQWFTIE
jgi:NitT/TauT family transport system substrate-binding protein